MSLIPHHSLSTSSTDPSSHKRGRVYRAGHSYRRVQRAIYELLLSPEIEGPAERCVRIGLFVLILTNVLAVVGETVAGIRARFATVLNLFEIVSVVLFTVEYVLRLWAAPCDARYRSPIAGRLKYAVSFYALVDLLAILPFYLPHIIPCDLRFIRGLRLIRLLSVFKLGRYSEGVSMYARILKEKRDELVVSLGLLLLLLLLSASTVYFFEHEAQPEQFASIPKAMWWAIVTLTTIGYGDVVPVTVGGRIFGAVVAVVGVGFVALPSAILVAGMMEQLALRREKGCGQNQAPQQDVSEEPSTKSTVLEGQPHPSILEFRCPHCGQPLLIQPPRSPESGAAPPPSPEGGPTAQGPGVIPPT